MLSIAMAAALAAGAKCAAVPHGGSRPSCCDNGWSGVLAAAVMLRISAVAPALVVDMTAGGGVVHRR